MRKDLKKTEVDYRTFVVLTLRQKLPSFLTGILVFLIPLLFIVSQKAWLYKKSLKETKPTAATTKDLRKRHIVAEGEDLWGIAQKYFGSGYNAFDIASANSLTEPYILNKGQVLVIPSVRPKKPTQGDITETSASTSLPSTKTMLVYTVKEGEYLFEIAQSIYGDGNLMSKIIEANKLPAPYDVVAGQKLLIPR